MLTTATESETKEYFTSILDGLLSKSSQLRDFQSYLSKIKKQPFFKELICEKLDQILLISGTTYSSRQFLYSIIKPPNCRKILVEDWFSKNKQKSVLEHLALIWSLSDFNGRPFAQIKNFIILTEEVTSFFSIESQLPEIQAKVILSNKYLKGRVLTKLADGNANKTLANIFSYLRDKKND